MAAAVQRSATIYDYSFNGLAADILAARFPPARGTPRTPLHPPSPSQPQAITSPGPLLLPEAITAPAAVLWLGKANRRRAKPNNSGASGEGSAVGKQDKEDEEEDDDLCLNPFYVVHPPHPPIRKCAPLPYWTLGMLPEVNVQQAIMKAIFLCLSR
ncbi:hypothetical protein C8Q79DRAFT_1005736 [Trametes meyenii]|nr:hypothetical protein C8Q79DRAFT_1005736 [Trametes meyenii]